MKKNANKGFSLVELIIVIAIMAVLIGVLAPQFIKQVEKSRESTDLQNVEEVKTAIETFVAENGENLTNDITIVITANTKAYAVNNASIGTGDSAKNLLEYGIDTSKLELKSGSWSAITWTYDCAGDGAKYTWAASPAASSAGNKYYNWDGSTK